MQASQYDRAGSAHSLQPLRSSQCTAPDGSTCAVHGLSGQPLQAQQALGLQLEQGLVGGEAYVVAALWRRASQAGALAASQQQNAGLSLHNTALLGERD